MRKRWLYRWCLGSGLAILATGRGDAQSPTVLVARAAAAMGGETALRSLTSTRVSFNAANFGLGQEETAASPARATFPMGQQINDFAGRRRSLSQETRPTPSAVARTRVVVAGEVGMSDNNGTLAPAGPAQIASNQRLMRLLPERLILAALGAPGALASITPRRLRGELADGVRYAGEDTVSIYFDRHSGLPLATESVTDDPILGDRRTLTLFTRWQDAGGVKFARQLDVDVNGRLATHTVVTAVTTNATLADSLFAIPDSIAARVQRGGVPALVVRLAEVAPSVWRAEGGSHHSLIVEQPAGLVVFEAPTGSAQTRALLDTLRSRFPRKPVGTVVMSHHHWDHSGGIREALAAGIPITAHERSADFVRQIAAARKTIAPDALSRRPRVPTVRSVSDSLTLGGGDSRLVLYSLPTTHVEGMLVGYLPASRQLFVVDVLSPGPAALPPVGSAEVAAMVRARGIQVDRVIGGHGGIANWADVERAARP